jgi:hypothetical protein
MKLLFSLLILGQNIGTDYPHQLGGFGERQAGFYNTLTIVRPIRRLPVENRKVDSVFGEMERSVIIEEVQVIDSSRKHWRRNGYYHLPSASAKSDRYRPAGYSADQYH